MLLDIFYDLSLSWMSSLEMDIVLDLVLFL